MLVFDFFIAYISNYLIYTVVITVIILRIQNINRSPGSQKKIQIWSWQYQPLYITPNKCQTNCVVLNFCPQIYQDLFDKYLYISWMIKCNFDIQKKEFEQTTWRRLFHILKLCNELHTYSSDNKIMTSNNIRDMNTK